ncbi:hypothetical protein RF55_6122 [Lasius niger]|uniref:Uncharacterized protein n=1 Tax=Lasius niger TaxID=67767 RepID=A0A0J7KTZ1_LASNI|nr:hypothetical protein RF55_6122 [Lasius niger]
MYTAKVTVSGMCSPRESTPRTTDFHRTTRINDNETQLRQIRFGPTNSRYVQDPRNSDNKVTINHCDTV